jgi:subtilisin-like proprotein convertase family protein
MMRLMFPLVLLLALAAPSAAEADLVYTYDANISGFDNQNVFTHTFDLGPVQEILEVSIELIHTRATDIDFTLKTPGGSQTFVLTTDNGSTSDLDGTYRFVSVLGPNGGNGFWPNLGANTLIPSGYYDAESWVSPANGWAAGTWTLILTDDASGEFGSVGSVSVTYAQAVPEPGAAMLLLAGLACTIVLARRKGNKVGAA